MAILAGFISVGVFYTDTPYFYTPIIQGRVRRKEQNEFIDLSTSTYPVVTNNTAINVVGGGISGGIATSFLNDYYYRVHITPSLLALNTIVTDTKKVFEVWNAWFVPETLTNIQITGTGGVPLTGPPAPPLVFAPLQSRNYTVNILGAGSAQLNIGYVFTFTVSPYKPALAITGVRLLVWWVRPNWDTPILERWDWLTNVITSRNRKEQRIKLRQAPRRELEYAVLAKNNTERLLLENLLFSWQSRLFGVPIWMDSEFLQNTLSVGSIQIPCTPATRDYEAGGYILLSHEQNYEIANIISISATYVTIELPTVYQWRVGTKVSPVRRARISNVQPITNHTDSISGMTVQFKLDEVDFRIPPPPLNQSDYDTFAKNYRALYLGLEVLLQKPNWADELNSEYSRDINVLDYATGRTLSEDTSGVPVIRRKYTWLTGTRNEFEKLRTLLFQRYGKLVPIWIPTFTDDFKLLEPVAINGLILKMQNTNYTEQVNGQVQRRDIIIFMKDGSNYKCRIVSATRTGNVELLDINMAPYTWELIPSFFEGIDYSYYDTVYKIINPEDIFQICFLNLYRLDSDSIEVSWETDSITKVATNFRTIRDDL